MRIQPVVIAVLGVLFCHLFHLSSGRALDVASRSPQDAKLLTARWFLLPRNPKGSSGSHGGSSGGSHGSSGGSSGGGSSGGGSTEPAHLPKPGEDPGAGSSGGGSTEPAHLPKDGEEPHDAPTPTDKAPDSPAPTGNPPDTQQPADQHPGEAPDTANNPPADQPPSPDAPKPDDTDGEPKALCARAGCDDQKDPPQNLDSNPEGLPDAYKENVRGYKDGFSYWQSGKLQRKKLKDKINENDGHPVDTNRDEDYNNHINDGSYNRVLHGSCSAEEIGSVRDDLWEIAEINKEDAAFERFETVGKNNGETGTLSTAMYSAGKHTIIVEESYRTPKGWPKDDDWAKSNDIPNSELIFQNWHSEMQDEVSRLKYIYRVQIENEETKKMIDQAFSNSQMTKDNLLTITNKDDDPNADAFTALCGSDNGRNAPYQMLQDHPSAFNKLEPMEIHIQKDPYHILWVLDRSTT